MARSCMWLGFPFQPKVGRLIVKSYSVLTTFIAESTLVSSLLESGVWDSTIAVSISTVLAGRTPTVATVQIGRIPPCGVLVPKLD